MKDKKYRVIGFANGLPVDMEGCGSASEAERLAASLLRDDPVWAGAMVYHTQLWRVIRVMGTFPEDSWPVERPLNVRHHNRRGDSSGQGTYSVC